MEQDADDAVITQPPLADDFNTSVGQIRPTETDNDNTPTMVLDVSPFNRPLTTTLSDSEGDISAKLRDNSSSKAKATKQ